MDFKPFDARNYPTLDVREGYTAWAPTYESTVLDEMDIRLLERLASVDWKTSARAIDLACGTGRIGSWLKSRGVKRVEGADFTPEMLEKARARGVYDALYTADIRGTGLEAGRYDLAMIALADEHLPDVGPLYEEARRLTCTGGVFVVVGYHSHFLMNEFRPISTIPAASPWRSKVMFILSATILKPPAPPGGGSMRWMRASSMKNGLRKSRNGGASGAIR